VATAVAATPRAGALEEAIRAIPADWFKPAPIVYWIDFLTSAAVGWAAFAVAVAARGWTRAGALVVATLALYRGVLFIHEITHLNAGDVPLFKFTWNLLVGVPLLIPSCLYEGVHTDHHRQRCYGTAADPEYVPYGRKRPVAIVLSGLLSLLAPIAFVARFAVLAPVGWLIPPLGRVIHDRASALVINARYVRHAPFDRAARVEEAGACALIWTVVASTWAGAMPAAVLVCWAAAVSAASFANALRTFAAHRYDHDHGELSMIEQLLDSCTIAPRGVITSLAGDVVRALAAPVGLRYHALHHWIPSLPYHNLGRAHRRLVAALAGDAPYRSTIATGFSPIIRDLFRRSRAQSS